MNDRREIIERSRGYESFRTRAAIPCDEDNNVFISTADDDSRLSSLSFVEVGTASTDEYDGMRELSTTLSDRSRQRSTGTILEIIKRASITGVVANMLLQDVKKKNEALAPFDDNTASTIEKPDIKSTNTSHRRNAGKYTVIAFVNSTSGGQQGKRLYEKLKSLLGDEYVVDLHSCTPGNMPEDTLLKYAYDPFVRILACGGDGTCGWLYSSLDKVWSNILGKKGRVHLSDQFKEHLPMAIMPLGTGNDLSRQFNWGDSFQRHMTQMSFILAVANADVVGLDRWRCLIMPTSTWGEEEKKFIPQILSEKDFTHHDPNSERSSLATISGLANMLNDEDENFKTSNKFVTESDQPCTKYFDGLFCNYFSMGFDATVLHMFHEEREKNPGKFTSPLRNKLVYVQKSPSAIRTPKLRKRIQLFVNNDQGDLVKLKIPKDARAVILLNIQSYASGNHLTKKGAPDDGIIEVIFVSNLIRMVSTALVGPVIPHMLFKVRAQTSRVCIRTKSPMHCQVDGEPWLQGEAVIQVKFHTMNAILKKKPASTNCGCISGSDNVVIS